MRKVGRSKSDSSNSGVSIVVASVEIQNMWIEVEKKVQKATKKETITLDNNMDEIVAKTRKCTK